MLYSNSTFLSTFHRLELSIDYSLLSIPPVRLPGGLFVVNRYLPISLFFCHVSCQSPLRRLLILNSVSEPTTQLFVLFSLNCIAMTAIIDFSAVNTSTYTSYSISCVGVNLLLLKHYVHVYKDIQWRLQNLAFVWLVGTDPTILLPLLQNLYV